jgi:multicomponent Na+:H+ antiporter subunit C
MTQFVAAIALGTLFAVGTYLALARDIVRIVWGLAIMSQAANVYLVTMGRFTGVAPVLGHGSAPPLCLIDGSAGCVTDPLVQALVLTAIVIGFGTTAFALVLTYRVFQEHDTIDSYQLGENR